MPKVKYVVYLFIEGVYTRCEYSSFDEANDARHFNEQSDAVIYAECAEYRCDAYGGYECPLTRIADNNPEYKCAGPYFV